MEPLNEKNQEVDTSNLSQQETNVVNQTTTQPVAPVLQSQPIQPVEPVPLQTSIVAPVKKKNIKLFVIIGAALLGLIAIGVAIWLFVFNSVPLREYDGGSYTVLVPQSFTEKRTSYVKGIVTFVKNPDVSDKDRSSYVEISYNSYGSSMDGRNAAVEKIDETYFNSEKPYFKNDINKANVKIEKTTRNQDVLRIVTADIMQDEKVIGKLNLTFKFTDKGMFSITTAALSEDSGLIGSVDNMVNSFKEK